MEMDLLLYLAIAVFAIVSLSAVDLFVGVKSMVRLGKITPLQDKELPMVSLIVPACNEAEKIEPAILSLLSQDYANFEVIAINDRSIDETGSILERIQLHHPKLRVFHIESLPQGWMGKAHALNFGADHAEGEYLLFTDGDILMESSTLSRAISHMVQERLDHVTLIFKNISPGLLLNSLILDSGAGLLQVFRPWKAKIKKSRYFIGVGAFNLVKERVYKSVGGHESIKMHPIDDIMLGKTIKFGGFRQECLLAHDLVTVPWYDGVGQMIQGLMKNVLAIINYQFLLVPPALAVLFILNILPLWGVFLFDGKASLFFGLTVLVRLITFYGGTRLIGISPLCVVGILVSPYITAFIVMRATWLNIRDKGIFWRGTHYPLSELRKNKSMLF
jgi:glycosyltransferase involved in cell wall biosynthesis